MKSRGDTKDERGRAGQEISIDADQRFIIDPASAVLLSWRATAVGKAHLTTYLQIGWTDAKPHVPELP